MLVTKVIEKKRLGGELTANEIHELIRGFTEGNVADYQMTAFAMAVCIRGMTPDEISALTLAMLESGDKLSREVSGEVPRVDKHSTGGLGDKVSLVLAPMLAACDLHVPMISGRGLGLTGGTLDKLESIEGFQTQLSGDAFDTALRQNGACIVGAGPSIAPADRRLYALRDVTGTVASTALITASILSKKLAASLDALVLDVKVGGGAFMQTIDQARELADSLQRVGALSGLKTSVLISDMDQPLGRAVGNAIEVNESLELLEGGTPRSKQLARARQLCIELGAMLLVDVGRSPDEEVARETLAQSIDNGSAKEAFLRMIKGQGGKLTGPLPLAPKHTVTATRSGHVEAIDCITIGETVVSLGGGRRNAGDKIDPKFGIEMNVAVGDRVESGDLLMLLHCSADTASDYTALLQATVRLADQPVAPHPLLIEQRPSRTLGESR
ncbi:MAG: thymidine phosphorylase [Planctomycetota bacterium]